MAPSVTMFGPAWSVHTQRWFEVLESAGLDVQVVSWARREGLRGMLRFPGLVRAARRSILASDVSVVQTLGSHGLLSLLVPKGNRQVLVPWGSEVYAASRSRWRRTVARRVIARSDVVLTTSRDFARVVRELAPGPCEIRTISWGIAARFLKPMSAADRAAARDKWQVPPDTTLVFAPRGDTDVYRLGSIVDAFESASAARPDLMLYAVGTSLRRRHGSGHERIRVVGALEPHEMFELMSIADAVVSVPVSDQRSTAVLEAIATGGQILLSDLPAYREILEDGAKVQLLGEPLVPALGASFATLPRRDPKSGEANRSWAAVNESSESCRAQLVSAVLGTEGQQ